MGEPDSASAGGARPARRGEPPHYLFRPVRTRALAEIDGPGGQPKLTAIVAPMGYGKTLLMAAMHARLEARGEVCYWTTLDERDTRVEDLLQRLEAQASHAGGTLHPTQALFRGDATLESRIDALVKTARQSVRPFTAFIDNLHFCTDPMLGSLLDRLVFETADSARFVVSSTAALPMNLARAKLEGRIRLIGYAELSLDLSGVTELLGPEVCSVLSREDIGAVLRQTEGWPAAVRMVQIMMSGAAQPRLLLQQFSGSDEDLVALLNRQVLSGLPGDVREFLLALAPLHTLSADLCEYATSLPQSQHHLDYLVRRNVFMIPLDRNRSRYRLHGLFRQSLIAEARQQVPAGRRKEVLSRAAEWSERQGAWRDAIDYALDAGATALAGAILERSAEAIVRNRGDTPQYVEWATTLLEQGYALGWEAEYWLVWALVLDRRYEEGRRQLERLMRRVQAARAAADDAALLRDLERRLDLVLVCVDVFTDNLVEADRKAARWLEDARGDDPFDVTAALCARSICCSSAYRFVEARSTVRSACATSFQTRSEYTRGWTVALTALPSILEGQYAQAWPELSAELGTLVEHLGGSAGICGTVALLAAHCAVEMGNDAEAVPVLEQGLRTASSHGFVDAVACGLDAALKLSAGGAEEAALLRRLRDIAGSYPSRLSLMLGCFLIRRMLGQGRLGEAQAEAASMGFGLEGSLDLPSWADRPRGRDLLVSTSIHLQIASGRGRAVESLITEQSGWARSEGRYARQVDLALAETLLEMGEGRSTFATRHLTRAIRLAAPRGIARPFSDLASALAPLVEDTKPSAWGFARAEERRFFADLCARMPIGDRKLQDRLVALNIEAHILEPLTRRQIELLGLLEAGLSNQQIADRIDRTLTTVKGHLQALYSKLGVSSRAAALARARVLHLLREP